LNLAVIIPAYNEADTIEHVINEIPSKIKYVDTLNRIIIDDGSSDDTYSIVSKLHVEEIIHHSINQGLGISFNAGIKKAIDLDVDYVIHLDADGQHSPKDISRFVECIVSQDMDLVLGSRFIYPKLVDMPFVKKVGNIFFSKLLSFLLKRNITDATSGFRIYSKKILPKLLVNSSFSYTIESLLNILSNAEVAYMEIPIIVSHRNGQSRIVKNWFDYGCKTMTIIVKTIYRYYFGNI
jgi:glycosyltransferase involved in cell wall biosynthesis